MRRTILSKKPTDARPRGCDSPMDAALSFLTHAPRTRREVERRLDELNYDEVAVYETVERLAELNLINDEAYAKDFVETRLASKPVSREHLRTQLVQHETEEAAMDAALSLVDESREAGNALLVAEKFNRTLSALQDEERYERVIKRLLSRGFSFDTSRAAMERMVRGEETE